MIIDYEAFVGHFAFRRVPRSDVPGLLEQMDEEEIDRALVSTLECVTYRNVQAGNEILAGQLAAGRGRLIGAAVANPAYPRAAEDTRLCLSNLGMKAIRLLPRYQGYRLGEEIQNLGFRKLMRAAAELNTPVSINFEIEDDRQCHPLFKPTELKPDEVAAAVSAHPEVTFVLERVAPVEVRRIHLLVKDAANWCVDLSGRSMLGATVHQGIADVLEWIGPDRVLLGTGMALQYPRAPFLNLKSLNLDEDTLDKIKGKNAARLLGIV